MKPPRGPHRGKPPRHGLYDPAYEHDACGAGFICDLRGRKSHEIIHQALEILVRLTHRGACGSDGKSGDGAGLLIQIPHSFCRAAASGEGIALSEPGSYGTGLVFLPQNADERAHCMEYFEAVVKSEKQQFLGWRPVPTEDAGLGEIARTGRPAIYQVFIGRGSGLDSQDHFERKLYVIRKVLEHTIRASRLTEKDLFYVPSLSSRTLVYKGLLLPNQIPTFFPDLSHPEMVSGLALVHQRYSTNTFPTWELAQPFRFLCHNGEINTLRGNVNWLNAREAMFESQRFGADIRKLSPVATPGASDSAILDNALELLYHTGRSLPHAIMMMIPEAWQNHESMSDEKRAFYEYHSHLMEPWDGPASIPFTDGKCIGAVLDRNGLRPSRYTVTKDGRVIMGSETGVVDVPPENVAYKGRLEPGRMFLVDMEAGRIVEDEEIKSEIAERQPYRKWLKRHSVHFGRLAAPEETAEPDPADRKVRQRAFGYTLEDLKQLILPMARDGKDPLGSMGDDTSIAALSDRPRLLYEYFKQLFAQVTNPPIDPIREHIVTSMQTTIGPEQDLFGETPQHCHQFVLPQPILTNDELGRLLNISVGSLRAHSLPILFDVAEGAAGLERAMNELCKAAVKAIQDGASILVLSDRGVDATRAGIPALLAVSGVHHHLIREGLRTEAGIVLESGEPREVHHFASLIGYGCGAINPYVAFEVIDELINDQRLENLSPPEAANNYVQAVSEGILKVISKMGISTLHSYRGAQIFEALGLNQEVVDRYFVGTATRLEGADLHVIAEETRRRHEFAYPQTSVPETLDLEVGGRYQWRRNGESHQVNPLTIAKLQQAVREGNETLYREYAEIINNAVRAPKTLRSMMQFTSDSSVPLDEVEPWTDIVKRFKTGAMSYGSISQEAHETLAIAMNRIGGKSNSGEGGEDEARFVPDDNGDLKRSAIKQVASGRFGVTSHYLVNAEEIQIKMAQGAKPGEGGELPGFKVLPWIAQTRHSTPYVGLISPPPHHDIYSIEDMAQLIHDLKNANPQARINVKLVSEVGVGTVAAGVSKGKADVILISGGDGGTGAAKQTSIKNAGLPWELGVAEAHQTLVLNDLRSRIRLEADGAMKTGRDVAVACLLGAEEFGFATTPLISMGCIMMRSCHLNNCVVGIATQDPELRKRFAGTPEHVVQFFRFVAEELREIMATLGYRTIDEMVGQSHRLEASDAEDHWKARGIDLSRILIKPEVEPGVGIRCQQPQDHGLEDALDHHLIELAQDALEEGQAIRADVDIRNIHRTVGTMLSYELTRRHGALGLPDDTIWFDCHGAAGQSFGAFLARGITLNVRGDANDYFGKGLSGGTLVIQPPEGSTFPPEDNILIGNVAFYGATSGRAYIYGRAGERFCVRNSGVNAVVEGVGDHGCEYMTGGRVVVLGATGRNFAAGMSGGIAYVYDADGEFTHHRCNLDTVELESVQHPDEIEELHALIVEHVHWTGSTSGQQLLDNWHESLPHFVKVMPVDYKKALERLTADAEVAREQDATARRKTG